MLVNIHHDSPKEHLRLLVAGIAFLVAISLLIWLSIAIYDKKFEKVTNVAVQADRAGQQLGTFGDVRFNGALVGYVKSVDHDGTQVVINLALDPESAAVIPDDVTVEVLPTTLFGQKYVQFVPTGVPMTGHLRDGDVIASDRVDTNVELSQILNDLFPLLRAVRPADLNYTLSALATALEGRGAQIGETLDELGEYLGVIDAHLPTLQEDLIALAEVADAYDLAAPDLMAVLANVTVTSKTIVEKRADLDTFFADLAGLARTTSRVLADNEQNLIRMGEVTAPVVALLAEYSPQLPCLIRGAAEYAPILAGIFEGSWVKQYIEFFTPQYRVWDERDLPVYGDVGHGPMCHGLPNFTVPAEGYPLNQGTDQDNNPPTSAIPHFGALASSDVDSGHAGTLGDQMIINAMLAGANGHEDPDRYGALGSLLYGPVVREGVSEG